MKISKLNKKSIILIIGGLFIIGVILLITLLFLLFLKPTNPNSKQQESLSNVESNNQQDKTYNSIINKIEKEVDDLTKKPDQNLTLKYPPKIYYFNYGKKIRNIQEYEQNTGIMAKSTHFYDDGKTIRQINEYNDFNLIKETYYNLDGNIKEIKTYETVDKNK